MCVCDVVYVLCCVVLKLCVCVCGWVGGWGGVGVWGSWGVANTGRELVTLKVITGPTYNCLLLFVCMFFPLLLPVEESTSTMKLTVIGSENRSNWVELENLI